MKPKKGRKRLFLPIFLVLILIIIALLPTLASTRAGNAFVIRLLERSLKMEIAASSLSLSWLGPQEVNQLRLNDAERGLSGTAAEVKTSSSLFQLIAFSFRHCPTCLKGSFTLSDAAFKIERQQMAPVYLDQVNVEILIPPTTLPIHIQAVGSARQQDLQGQFNLALDLENLEPSHPRLSAQLTMNNFPLLAVDQLLALYAPRLSGALLTSLGSTLNLDLNIQTEAESHLLHLKARGQRLSADIDMQLEKEQLTLQNPVQIALDLPGILPGIAAGTRATVRLDAFSVPLNESELDFAHLSGRGSVALSEAYGVKNPLLTITTSDLSDELHLSLKGSNANGQARVKERTILLTLATPTFNITDALFTIENDTLTLKQAASVRYAPPPFEVASLAPLEGTLNTLSLPLNENWASLSLTADLACDRVLLKQIALEDLLGTLSVKSLQDISLDVTSPKLKASLKGAWQDTTLKLKSSSTIDYTVTQSDLPSSIRIEEPAVLHCTLSPITVTDGKLVSPLETEAHLDQVMLANVGSLDNLQMKARLEPDLSTIEARLQADAVTGHSKGILECSLVRTERELDISLKAQKFPPVFLNLITTLAMQQDLQLTNLFGTSVALEATLSLQNASGPLSLSLHSPKARLSAKGSIKQGILQLSEPLHAQAHLTPALAALLFEETNPLLLSDLRAEAPLTLEIPAEGVSIPLFPYNPAQLSIPKARIELGQVTAANAGNLNVTLGLLKSSLSKSKELKLWFTPIDLHIMRGIVDIERTEILVDNSLEVCTWGRVDLIKERVDMVLGLTAQCLKKAFGIKDLKSDYVLQLPMTGPLNNVKLDTGKATAKITALLLWQKSNLAGALGGGLPGAIVGELVGKLATLPDKDSHAPAAKRPFPWDKQQKTSSKEEDEEKEKSHKVRIRKEDDPIKQLLKFFI